MLGQMANENAFYFSLRLVFFLEAGVKFAVLPRIFAGEEVETGVVVTETVRGAVLGRSCFAFFGSGSGGTLSVQLIGVDLCGGRHGLILSGNSVRPLAGACGSIWVFGGRDGPTNDFSLLQGACGEIVFRLDVIEKKGN